jgi:hypothetical protein
LMSMPTAVLNGRAHDGGVADVDPAARPRRRVFSAEYKLAILAEYAAAPEGVSGTPERYLLSVRSEREQEATSAR